MKFYFCEICGKRVTEKNISEGEGRDKKLRGVYCTECAVGVSTLDTIPMKDTEALELVKSEQKRAASSAARQRRTSGQVALPRSRRGSSNRIEPAVRPAVQDVSRGKMVLAGILGCLATFLVVGLVVYVASDEKPRAERVVRKKAVEEDSEAKVKVASTEDSRDVGKKSTTLTTKGMPGPATTRHEDATTQQVAASAENTDPEDNVGPTVVAESKDEPKTSEKSPVGKTSVESVAPELVNSPDSKAAAPADAAEQPAPEKAEDSEAVAKKAYFEFAQKFFAALQGLNERDAEALHRKAVLDPALKSRQEACKRDHMAVEWVRESDGPFRKGLEKLAEVDSFELRMRNGSVMRVGKKADFQMKGIRGDKIDLGKEKMQIPYPIARLHDSTRCELILLGLPKDGNGLQRKAFYKLLVLSAGKSDLEAEQNSIRATVTQAQKAGADENDAAAVLAWLDLAVAIGLESEASLAWEKGEALFKAKKWKEARAAFESMGKRYAETRFVSQRSEQLRERLAAIRMEISPYRAGLAASYFRGSSKDKPINESTIRARQIDANVDFDWFLHSSLPDMHEDGWSVRWEGYLKAPTAGKYTLLVRANDGARMWLAGEKIVDCWAAGDGVTIRRKTVSLRAGFHEIKLEMRELNNGASCRLLWSLEDGFSEEVVPPHALFHDPRHLSGPDSAKHRIAPMNPSRPARLVLWNLPSRTADEGSTAKCRVAFYLNGKEVHSLDGVELPVGVAETAAKALDVPAMEYDRIRVEILTFRGKFGGLSEIQLIQGGRNIIEGCRAQGSSLRRRNQPPANVTNGDTKDRWEPYENNPGWVDVWIGY